MSTPPTQPPVLRTPSTPPSPCPQDHPPSSGPPCPQDPPHLLSPGLPVAPGRARQALSDLWPHPWVPWSQWAAGSSCRGRRGAASACLPPSRRVPPGGPSALVGPVCGPCPSGPFRPTDMWSLQVVMLVACPSRQTRALQGGTLGEEALREPASVCRALFPWSPWQRAWPITHCQARPQPREESRQGPGGSSVPRVRQGPPAGSPPAESTVSSLVVIGLSPALFALCQVCSCAASLCCARALGFILNVGGLIVVCPALTWT